MAEVKGKTAESPSRDDDIKPYRVRVSSKYIELTKRKLELARLPHDVADSGKSDWWEPRPHVEPLIDFWLEQYSWRKQEDVFNDSLAQYRVSIPLPSLEPVPSSPNSSYSASASSASVRIHFIHARSARDGAVPLLLLPTFPFTNLSLGHLVDLFTAPQDSDDQAFHVVMPALPGTGFSDALPGSSSGSGSDSSDVIAATAGIFDALMTRLSYPHYLVSNTGSASASPGHVDWHLANQLATHHAASCLGTHLVSPPLSAPRVRDAPIEWTKWSIAKFFRAPILGYDEADFSALRRAGPIIHSSSSSSDDDNSKRGSAGRRRLLQLDQTQSSESASSSPPPTSPSRQLHKVGIFDPDTLAYALCDSPVGLLVCALKGLRALGPRKELSQTEIITLAMLAWLPGPEAGLRYWANCATRPPSERAEGSAAGTRPTLKNPRVVITAFLGDDEETVGAVEGYACPGWARAKYDVLHAQRVPGSAGLLAWERPELITQGVASLAKRLATTDDRLTSMTAPLHAVVVAGDGAIHEAAERDEGEAAARVGDSASLQPGPARRPWDRERDSWRLGRDGGQSKTAEEQASHDGVTELDGASPDTIVVTPPGR